MKTREQNRNNKRAERERLACSKRSDSGERCEVKKARKVEGDSPLPLPRFYFFALLFTWHRSPLSERLEQARERFDWFIERIQTRVAFDWLRECWGEKTSSRELSRNLTIIRFDDILQHDWPIEQSPLHIRFFFGGKTKSACFDLFIHWLIKQVTNTLYENRSDTLKMLAFEASSTQIRKFFKPRIF